MNNNQTELQAEIDHLKDNLETSKYVALEYLTQLDYLITQLSVINRTATHKNPDVNAILGIADCILQTAISDYESL